MKLLQHLCSASPEPRMNAHNCSQLERGKKGLATHNTISVEDTWVAHCTWVISKLRKIKRRKARWLDFLRLLLPIVTSQQLLQLQHDTQLFQVLICELTRHIQIKTFESRRWAVSTTTIPYEIKPCFCKSNHLQPLGFYKVWQIELPLLSKLTI